MSVDYNEHFRQNMKVKWSVKKRMSIFLLFLRISVFLFLSILCPISPRIKSARTKRNCVANQFQNLSWTLKACGCSNRSYFYERLLKPTRTENFIHLPSIRQFIEWLLLENNWDENWVTNWPNKEGMWVASRQTHINYFYSVKTNFEFIFFIWFESFSSQTI